MNPLRQALFKFANVIGYELLPHSKVGTNPFADMRRNLMTDSPVIFDVGANKGQSVVGFRREFPNCSTYSFEPSPNSFKEMKQNVSHFENAHLYNAAVGSTPGKMPFIENSNSTMSSLLPLNETHWGGVEERTTEVDVMTIDQVCSADKVDRIDILKSDAQGYDLEVCKGATDMLKNNRIGMVYVEVIFTEMYEGLATPDQLYKFLIDNNFQLVSFYRFHYRQKVASYSDGLFVNRKYFETYGD